MNPACAVLTPGTCSSSSGNVSAPLAKIASRSHTVRRPETSGDVPRGGEPGWQLPLFEEYKDLIKSDVADMRNIGGRGAGTITAALLLAEFAEGMPWVHLDVAGTAYAENDLGIMPKGPTGTPVRTFVEFVRGRAR